MSAAESQQRPSSASPGLEDQPKRHLSVVFIGHVDCGKSTLIGHLLSVCGTENGGIEQSVVETLERESAAVHRRGAKYAWVV